MLPELRLSASYSGHAASFCILRPTRLVDFEDATSRCIRLVSGIKTVKHIPIKLTTAKATSVVRVPTASCKAPNPNAPTIPPSLPAAAETPWSVDRNFVAKTSAGTMNVIALGPKLAKKNVNA